MGWETSGQAETRSQLTCIQCLWFLSTPSFSRLGQAGASHTLTVSLLLRVPLPHVTEKQMETQVWSHSVKSQVLQVIWIGARASLTAWLALSLPEQTLQRR